MSFCIGPYQLGSTLGVGTFGKVRLAVHQGTQQKVAVKILNKAKMLQINLNSARGVDMLLKIRREINILQTVTHPHLIRLYELIDTPTDIFMVMEYVPGGELFDYIVQKSRLPEHEARRFFQQIVSGVDYCHQQLVCHRDLKPENVLLDSNVVVKIGDFGLSNFMHDGDYLKTSCGSPNYASPEVVSNRSYAGPEVDVWSCGVILYALLCGSLPFDDEHVGNLFQRIRRGYFTIPGHLSEAARSLIVSMLVVDPAKRYTLREVRRHPWFRANLPPYLSAPILTNMFLTSIDSTILAEMRRLGYEVSAESIELQPKAGCNPSRESVAYQLLADKKARLSSSSCWLPASIAKCSALLGAGGEQNKVTLTSKDLIPVFSSEVQKKAAVVAALQVDHATYLSDPFNPYGVSRTSSQLGGSLAYGRQMSSSGVGNNRMRIGAAEAAAARWKLGIESTLDSPSIVTAILTTLKGMGYQWHLVSPYRIRCMPAPRAANPFANGRDNLDPTGRGASHDSSTGDAAAQAEPVDAESNTPTEHVPEGLPQSDGIPESQAALPPHNSFWRLPSGAAHRTLNPKTVLTVQLYKIAASRYLIDVQIFDGPFIASLSESLWVTSAIYATLTQLQHRTVAVRQRTPPWGISDGVTVTDMRAVDGGS